MAEWQRERTLDRDKVQGDGRDATDTSTFHVTSNANKHFQTDFGIDKFLARFQFEIARKKRVLYLRLSMFRGRRGMAVPKNWRITGSGH